MKKRNARAKADRRYDRWAQWFMMRQPLAQQGAITFRGRIPLYGRRSLSSFLREFG